MVDASDLLVEGPWHHRLVAANGARFHVAEAGQGPLVVLLHGFPQFWWAWRHQLPALASAGYHAVAMDLRGYGASDKPPRGYDPFTSTADVAGVVRSLGATRAVVIGHGWGGWIAWSMPGLTGSLTHAIAALSMPHPMHWRRSLLHRDRRRIVKELLRLQVPMLPERRLRRGPGVDDALAAWAGPGYPDAETAHRYRSAMQVPFVAHTSLEYFRWAVRSLPRRDGRRFATVLREPIPVPVLAAHGEFDPSSVSAWSDPAQGRHPLVTGPLRWDVVPGVGHFLPEEAPAWLTATLIGWLDELRPW